MEAYLFCWYFMLLLSWKDLSSIYRICRGFEIFNFNFKLFLYGVHFTVNSSQTGMTLLWPDLFIHELLEVPVWCECKIAWF